MFFMKSLVGIVKECFSSTGPIKNTMVEYTHLEIVGDGVTHAFNLSGRHIIEKGRNVKVEHDKGDVKSYALLDNNGIQTYFARHL